MASFVPGKMKRKGFDEVYDVFSDLSISAPALKIRRLDTDLPPIMEERGPIGPSVLEPQLLKGDMGDAVPDVALVMEEIFPPTVNEERALVLYKPVHSHFVPSLNMDPELISGLKDPAFWPVYQNLVEEDFVEEQQQSSSINRLAVIPWVPSYLSAPGLEVSSSENGPIAEIMEEGADGESMEIDGDHNGQLFDAGFGSGSFHQWQKHCMIPEHTHITSTPILGSW